MIRLLTIIMTWAILFAAPAAKAGLTYPEPPPDAYANPAPVFQPNPSYVSVRGMFDPVQYKGEFHWVNIKPSGYVPTPIRYTFDPKTGAWSAVLIK